MIKILVFDFCFKRNTDLTISNLVLHLPGLLRGSAEEQYSTGQPVEPVYGTEILQVVFLGQNEYDSVVAITTARMNLQTIDKCLDQYWLALEKKSLHKSSDRLFSGSSE